MSVKVLMGMISRTMLLPAQATISAVVTYCRRVTTSGGHGNEPQLVRSTLHQIISGAIHRSHQEGDVRISSSVGIFMDKLRARFNGGEFMQTKNVHSLDVLNTQQARQRKTIIVSGAGGGIGKKVCEELAKSAHNIILLGRDEQKLLAQAQNLRTEHEGFYVPVSIDFTDGDSLKSFVDLLSQALDDDVHIDGLVLMTPRISATTIALPEKEAWLEVLTSNFVNPLELIKGLVPFLARNNRSKVVVISGISSVQVLSHYAINNALRAAWLAQAKTLAFAYGNQNIHFNTISLGGVMTETYEQKIRDKAQANKRTFAEQMELEVSNVPLAKYAKPEEVARAIAVMLGDFSDHLTGHNLILDGGFTRAYS